MQLMECLERCEQEESVSAMPENWQQRKESLLKDLQHTVHQDGTVAVATSGRNWIRIVANFCFVLLFGASFYFYWQPASLVHKCTEASLSSQADLSPAPAMLAALVIHADNPPGEGAEKVNGVSELASCVNTTDEGYFRFESVSIDSKELINQAMDAGNLQYLVFEEADIVRLLAVLKSAYGVDFQFNGNLPNNQFSGFISKGLNVKMVVKLLVSSGAFTASIRGKKVVLSARI